LAWHGAIATACVGTGTIVAKLAATAAVTIKRLDLRSIGFLL
jgi:hypothetical protein